MNQAGPASLPTNLLDPQLAKIRPVIESMRAADGVQLKGRVWQGKPGLPVVIYLHGIEGHSAWFENTAAVLSQRGITVYAPDRRGSGLNPRDRGHLNDHKEFLSDVEAIMRRVSSLYVGHPIVLMANCWSARAASIIARKDYKPVTGSIGTPLSGLVLTCPAIFTKADFDKTTKFKIFYEWIQGSYRLLRYWPIPLTTEMFTDNPPYLEYVENDNLRLKEATTSFYAQTFIMNWRAKRAAPFIDLPTIVLQAGSDRIVDIEKLEAWYAKINTTQKTMRIFPDAVHSLDFDQTWFRDYTHLLTEWLLARSPVSV